MIDDFLESFADIFPARFAHVPPFSVSRQLDEGGGGGWVEDLCVVGCGLWSGREKRVV